MPDCNLFARKIITENKKKMAMNLDISKDLVKEAVCEKLERFQSLPMVMQTLESNGMRNDQILEQLGFIMGAEFESITAKV